MLQMASVFRGAGVDSFGGPMGGQTQPSFPAPGNPNAPQTAGSPTTPAAPGTTPATGGTAPLPNLYGQFGDPSALMQLLGGVGGAGFGPGAGAAALPAGPPPEERFQVQLQVRRLTLGCWLDLAHVPPGSNYKIWDSPTPLKTCVHFLRQAGMCTPQ